MKKISLILKVLVINFFIFNISSSGEMKYFEEGKKLFNEKKYDDSKFMFEKNIVFNTKNEKSYLYLAKIFEIRENNDEMEKNLSSVLLINPKNEEAIYLLMKLKVKQSNMSEVKNLLEKFKLVCVTLCNKDKNIENEIKSLNPEQ